MTKQADDAVTASLVTLGALTAAAAIVVAFVLGVARWQSPASVDDGVRSISDGHYSSAVRTLLAAVAQAPADARAHYYLGLAYAHLGVQTGAISQFQDAVRLVPREPKFHAGLGRAYREVGDRPAARGELEEAVRLDPDEPRYQIGLAGILLDDGQGAAAIVRLRRAARLRPRAAEVHLLLATVLDRAGDRSATVQEYDETRRLAGEGPLGEIAHQALRAAGSRERSVQ
ncbi:MAG: hypothetical protein AUH29_05945 [Candidatus Rokubacteria bacterium 13_1_40CM_69_27]|nr:MAG: hypothetical protein AUH29_05945 [Candidatus Rokubacteria bacterium 13_1_40CM_69_27]